MINGVPQNDPEDHNVYWIDFPDLLASTDNIQVQRGAGSAFYGPPAIGGSVNLVTNPFSGEPGLSLEMMTGFQEFGDSYEVAPPDDEEIRRVVHLRARRGAVHVLRPARQDHERRVQDEFVGRPEFLLLRRDQVRRRHVDAVPFLRRPDHRTVSPTTASANLSTGTGFSAARTSSRDGRRIPRETPTRRCSSAVPRKPESFSQPHAELMNDWKISSSAHAAQHALLLHRGRLL